MDKLKQYLQEHRGQMDVEIPPTDLLPYIQASVIAHAAAKVVWIKYIIGFSILATLSTGVWLAVHQQKPAYTPAPVTPQKEVIPTDTVPVQKDTMPAQPVIKHKKIRQAPPSPPAIPKHKKNVDTVKHEPQPRIKVNVDTTVHPPQPRIKKPINT